VPAKGTRLDITVEVRDRAHAEMVFERLNSQGHMKVEMITSEMID
jgi:hypothetical protein